MNLFAKKTYYASDLERKIHWGDLKRVYQTKYHKSIPVFKLFYSKHCQTQVSLKKSHGT